MQTHKNIKLLSWFNFFLDLRFFYPIAAIYFSQIAGSYALGMSIYSITMLTSALCELPTGIFSDFIGRKNTIVAGAVMSLLAVIFYAIGGQYLILVIGAVFQGISFAFYSGNNEALLIDTLTEFDQQEEYNQYYGTTSAMFYWAQAISAVIGSVIANFSFVIVFWISAIPALFGLLISFQISEPKKQKQNSTNIFSHLLSALRQFKTNSRLRTLSISKTIGFAQGEAGYQFRSIFINTLWPVWAIGIVQFLSNIGSAFSFHISGKIIKKYKSLPVLLFGKIYAIISNTIATLFPNIASPVILSSNSLFFGTGSVASSDLLQKEFTSTQRSTMGSINSLFGSVLFAIVSILLGFFADQIGPANALLSLQGLSLISVLILWGLFKHPHKETAPKI